MSETVLVADGSAFERRLLRETLAEHHDVVGVAENGVEAVELHRKHEPTVLVTVIQMRIRDGLDAAEEIAESGTGVVVCSAVEDDATVRSAREAGADEYVAKPFQVSNLLEAIDAATSA